MQRQQKNKSSQATSHSDCAEPRERIGLQQRLHKYDRKPNCSHCANAERAAFPELFRRNPFLKTSVRTDQDTAQNKEAPSKGKAGQRLIEQKSGKQNHERTVETIDDCSAARAEPA